MSTRAQYHRLNLGPAPKTRRTLVGYTVVADYVDPSHNQRQLVFERPVTAPAPKPKPVAKKKSTVTVAKTKATDFPTPTAAAVEQAS